MKCLHCKYQVSGKCPQTGTALSKCPKKDKHRYNMVVVVPNGGGARRTRITETKNFDLVLAELSSFKKELIESGFHRNSFKKVYAKSTMVEFAANYLDVISGAASHTFMNSKRSANHCGDSKRALARFMTALKNKGYNIGVLNIEQIGNDEVQIFHEYLLDDLTLGERTYNKHFVILKTFFNWVIKSGVDISNPFALAKLHTSKKEKIVISKSEFLNLINVIKPENGFCENKSRKEYHYRDWLIVAFRLALETGLRREELIMLKWNDLIRLETNVLVFKIENLKVNRILNSADSGKYIKYIPVTRSLKRLLTDIGYKKLKGSDSFIIDRPSTHEMRHLMDTMSRSFTHFIRQVTDRKIQFKHLRKTYITAMAAKLGDKCGMFTGHSEDSTTLKDNYISSEYMASKLADLSIF